MGWGAGRGGRVLSWGWSSWIPHHGNRQTFTKHWGISSYQLDYWSPQRAALVRNKCWISSGPWQGLEPHCHLHLFPLRFFLFLTEWGSCFLWAYSPLQFHSSLVLAFLPLFPFLSFFEKESLCVTPFLAPLCYAVRIVTQWRTESWQWVWSSGSSSVLLVTSTPVLQLFYLGLICQQDQECCGLRLRILPLINAKGGHSLVLCELHWLSLIWQSQKPPGAQRMP